MARWLAPLAAILLLVLAGHGVVLWTVGQQLQAASSMLDGQADPLFTRQITQQTDAPKPTKLPETAVPPAPLPPALPKPSAAQPSSPEKVTPSIAKNALASSTVTAALSALAVSQASSLATETSATTVTSSLALTSATLPATATLAGNNAAPTNSASEAVNTNPTSTLALSNTATNLASNLATNTTTTAAPIDPAASLALQGTWPSDTRLTYQLGGYYRGELHGDAQVQWSRLAPAGSDRYQVRVSINVGPIGTQFTSQGRIRATGLQPEIYEEKLPNGSRRKVTLEAQDIVLNDGKRLPKPTAQQHSVQDAASQFVELGQRFSSGRASLAPGEVVRMWLARPAGLDEWTYDVGPAETVYLPTLGAVQAYALTPRPIANKRGTITAQLWVAPSLQNLPVRIKITLNNETHVDLMVKKIEQR